MGKKFDFDYIVIGSGPAGSAVATGLVKAKKHVALVEGRYWGGSNLNTRDIPYDVALDFSHSYRTVGIFFCRLQGKIIIRKNNCCRVCS